MAFILSYFVTLPLTILDYGALHYTFGVLKSPWQGNKHVFHFANFILVDQRLLSRWKYAQTIQWDYFTKRLWIFFFNFFIRIFFWMKSFATLLKIHVFASIEHIFCVNHCWINMNFSKCVDFGFHFENLS